MNMYDNGLEKAKAGKIQKWIIHMMETIEVGEWANQICDAHSFGYVPALVDALLGLPEYQRRLFVSSFEKLEPGLRQIKDHITGVPPRRALALFCDLMRDELMKIRM